MHPAAAPATRRNGPRTCQPPAAARRGRPDYPAELPLRAARRSAGFSWNPGGADPDDHPGYFTAASRQRFDFHTGPAGAEGPPGTGVGLLQVSRDPLGNDTTIVSYDQFQLKPRAGPRAYRAD